MNLGEMETMLRKLVNNPATADQPASTLYECLNLGNADLCDRINFRELRTRLRFDTDDQHNLYTLPADFYEVKHIRYADSDDRGGELEKVSDRIAFELDSGSVAGRPQYYRIWGKEIQLYPPPDDVYTIEIVGRQKPAVMAAPTDIPDIPVSWHYGIVKLGCWYYWDGIGVKNLTAAKDALESFNVWATGRKKPFNSELDSLEQAVEVPTLGRWSGNRRGDMSPEQWRRGPY